MNFSPVLFKKRTGLMFVIGEIALHITETQFVVRYKETDRMGIVHHSNYPVWYEMGRTDFIKSLGISYSKIESMGILLPLVRLECNFKAACCYEDVVTVKTSIKKLSPARIEFYYQVFNNTSQVLANEGLTEHAFTTTDLKPMNLKKHNDNIYQMLVKAYGQ